MLGTSLLDRLRQRDPGYAVLRRAARLTLVASTVFYACRYGLDSTVLATYALFGTIATGVFAELPGSPRRRAATLLAALPVAWALIAAGTLLAGNTWAAAGGMLVVGFAVVFAGVGGPRLVGLASAFQLFYILASFPPYQPATLLARLGGVTLGVALLAAAEVVLWPDPVPVSYRQRLARAADRLAALLDATAVGLADPTGERADLDARRRRAAEAVAGLRLAQLPATQRPTAADAGDRALRAGASAAQEILVAADRLAAAAPPRPIPDLEAVRLLRRCAEVTRAAGRGLLSGAPPVACDGLVAASRGAEAGGPGGPGSVQDLPRMCRDALAAALADQVQLLAAAARVASGSRVGDASIAYPGLVDDARHGPWVWYWRQLRAHLTLRAAPVQTALRLAVALAAARLVAGTLNLRHGFWVLLATLTVLRTSAADTRTALRPALLGTIAGALASGLLMVVADNSMIYAVALPVTMVLAFSLGRLLGPAWAQAMFTVLLTFVFAQLAPEGWRLAEVRLVDVLLGGAIGVLAGVLLWPRGASRDLRRNAAGQLAAGADVIGRTVEAVVGGDRPEPALDRARRALVLADASYTQYHNERPDPRLPPVDWQAVLAAGHHVVHGAESLLRRNPPGCLAEWPAAAALLRESAGPLRSAYQDAAAHLADGRPPRPVVTPARCPESLDRIRPVLDESGARLPVRHLVEVDLWLAGLADILARIGPAADPARRRHS